MGEAELALHQRGPAQASPPTTAPTFFPAHHLT